ncbi:MAG TPA: thioredoxin domain-containing protein [Terriglobales bacterium]|nr:thioredoxin domain-containing protein [Terriglobales bacterium]
MKRLSSLALLPGIVILLAAGVSAADKSSLKPPPGSSVAIIVFEDLQCPDCARAAPLLAEAARVYKIPLVRHDFPLNQHPWAFDAAVLARFFDTQSKKLGDEFRETVFKNQPQITKENLRSFAEKFGAEHNVQMPFAIDPRGELAAKVQADRALGNRVGLEHTPTIYVVSNRKTGEPFVEVVDRSQLFQLIDQMKKEAQPAASASKPAVKKKS